MRPLLKGTIINAVERRIVSVKIQGIVGAFNFVMDRKLPDVGVFGSRCTQHPVMIFIAQSLVCLLRTDAKLHE